jgi:cellulose synthase/poly-beta-1,6-N-acetylglucosamine synthase-like glycosyltransferase
MILLAVSILFLLTYSALIIYYYTVWHSIPIFKRKFTVASVRISVIIPARNEEKNIGALLKALENQNYPKEFFEVIVADDHSEDGTAGVVHQFPFVKLLQLKEDNINAYKKKAIEKAIAIASGEMIVTTDADCLPPINWLSTIASFIKEKNPVFIAAPVLFAADDSMLQQFQMLDFMVLQGITGASVYKGFHSMCNGANLAYERNAFYEVNGFSGIDNIASGDDMLLMHKISKKNPGRIEYLKSKEAIVSSLPMQTWKEFFNQRIRWASKAKNYDDKKVFAVLLFVYLFNLLFPVLLIAGFWCYYYWLIITSLLAAKTMVEWIFVSSLSRFFSRPVSLFRFILFQPLHISYTLIAGLLGQMGRYEWKGRKVR